MSVYIRDTKHEHGKAASGFQMSDSGSDDDWETDPNYVNDISEQEQRWGSKEIGTEKGAVRDIHAIRDQAKSQDVVAGEKEYLERGKFSRGYGGENGVEGEDATVVAEPRSTFVPGDEAPAAAGGAGGAAHGSCRALYDYDAQEDGELSFHEGDVITILEKIDDGWWSGEFNGSAGVFPANFVEEC